MKKLILGAAPVLAVMAFAVMPAMAQAETKEYGTCGATGTVKAVPPCKVGEEFFTPFKVATKVIDKKHGTKPLVLENKAKTADISCTTFSSAGTYENKEKVGHSTDKLTFDGCTGSGAFEGCEVNPKTNHEITGEITDVVVTEKTVKIEVVKGFDVIVVCSGIEKNLGEVTGSAVAKVEGDVSKFQNNPEEFNLVFAGEKSKIEGEAETVTEAGSKPVVIN
jgi:hypothetical protein